MAHTPLLASESPSTRQKRNIRYCIQGSRSTSTCLPPNNFASLAGIVDRFRFGESAECVI
jgi:hypothetical protein